jgi:hypothetical protein
MFKKNKEIPDINPETVVELNANIHFLHKESQNLKWMQMTTINIASICAKYAKDL